MAIAETAALEIMLNALLKVVEECDKTIAELRKELAIYKNKPGLLNATSKVKLSNAMQQYNNRPTAQQVEDYYNK